MEDGPDAGLLGVERRLETSGIVAPVDFLILLSAYMDIGLVEGQQAIPAAEPLTSPQQECIKNS